MSTSRRSTPRSPTSRSRASDIAPSAASPLNARQAALPRGSFDTADGGIVITCTGDEIFRAPCERVVDRPDWLDDPPFATTAERIRQSPTVLALLRAISAGRPSAHWSERCARAGVPWAAIRTVGEALGSAEAMERGIAFDLAHPAGGRVAAIGEPFRWSRTPPDYRATPLLGRGRPCRNRRASRPRQRSDRRAGGR